MLKLIESDGWDFGGESQVTVLDTAGVGGLVKSAATDDVIKEYIGKMVPEPDKMYVHILAMGAGEYFGANRNADYFPEQNLIEWHKTFETSPAHVFRNHVNKNPEIAIGKVVFSIYNKRMHRVELIAWIDKNKGADIVQRMEQGEFPATSMACKTPYDECAICGNKASTRQEYCEHLSDQLGRIYPDGRKAMALNTGALKFFDISIVVRPADVTSSILQKVASDGAYKRLTVPTVGSAELAEKLGLVEKTAALKKLSEMIKEIDGQVVGYDTNLNSLLDKVSDPEPSTASFLAKHDLHQVLSTMAHLGISPSLGFLSEIIGHKIAGAHAEGVGDLIEGYFAEHGAEGVPLSDLSFGELAPPNPRIVDALSNSVKQASLFPEYVMGRAVEHNGSLYAAGTGQGYAGNGPRIAESPAEQYRRLAQASNSHEQGGLLSMIKTLVTIGGAALAAKWYIAHAIEQRAKELNANQTSPAKIVIIKSASDLQSANLLAKADFIRSVRKV